MKKYLLLVLFFTFLLLEINSNLWLDDYIVRQLELSDYRKMGKAFKSLTEADNPVSLSGSESAKFPHPYFAHNINVNCKNYEESRCPNFETEQNYRMKRQDVFKIGLFGGSVAGNLFQWNLKNNYLSNLIEENLGDIFKKKVKLINFAQGRAKQPRQFFIASLYSSNIDLAINIEGVNELNSDSTPEYPIYYPDKVISNLYYRKDLAGLLYRNEAIHKIKLIKKISNFSDRWGVLATIRVFLNSILIKLNKDLVYLQTEIKNMPAEDQFYKNDAPNKIDHVKFWLKMTKLQSLVLREDNVPLIAFIQPVPYYSKKLTDKEKGFMKMHKEMQINNLIEAMNYAKEEIVKSKTFKGISLLEIFKHHSDTLYTDFCCHLNDKGKKILSENIVKHIKNVLKTY